MEIQGRCKTMMDAHLMSVATGYLILMFAGWRLFYLRLCCVIRDVLEMCNILVSDLLWSVSYCVLFLACLMIVCT